MTDSTNNATNKETLTPEQQYDKIVKEVDKYSAPDNVRDFGSLGLGMLGDATKFLANGTNALSRQSDCWVDISKEHQIARKVRRLKRLAKQRKKLLEDLKEAEAKS